MTMSVTVANSEFMLFPSIPVLFSRGYSSHEFSGPANPTAQQTQLTNDYKNIITAFGVSYSHAPGTVVTAWWESSHVLILIGFLSLS